MEYNVDKAPEDVRRTLVKLLHPTRVSDTVFCILIQSCPHASP